MNSTLPSYNSILKICFILLFACFAKIAASQQAKDVQHLNDAVRNITDVIVHDVLTPPVASRVYAYSTIAGYEVIQMSSDSFPSLHNKINKMPSIPPPGDKVDFTLAGILAMYFTAQHFLPSNQLLYPAIDSFTNLYRGKLDQKILINSQVLAKFASVRIIAWSENDGFEKIHTLPRYELIDAQYAWQPTPPDYADPVEPYWGMLRTFALDSVSIIPVDAHIPFSTDSNSQFYLAAKKLIRITDTLTGEQELIAKFWDDNPYTSYYVGHMQYGKKKISPGGHWLDITRIAIETSGCDLVKAAQAYACVSVAMADGFISCWNEKYRSNLLRPETYINRYIDENWRPYLQTPPFPEHTSGHSVVSFASATVLTYLFGGNFAFTDQIETEFGLPERHFASFDAAAGEASFSRVLAGIHFEQGVESGVKQGKAIGQFIIGKLLDD